MSRPSRVATIAVGYADGWLRSSGHRGSVGIAGQRAPVVGRISMDLITIDVTGIDPSPPRPGALVDLLDEAMASMTPPAPRGTIGYEMLTAIGRRHLRRLSQARCHGVSRRRSAALPGLSGRHRAAHHLHPRPPSAIAAAALIYPRLILRQMIDIGYYSLPVVGLTAIFTGMVLALQTYTGF